MKVFVAAIAATVLLVATAAMNVDAGLPLSHTFPARLRNTAPYHRAVSMEREYSSRLGHASNATVNWVSMPIYHTGAAGEATFQARWYYDTTFVKDIANIKNAILYLNGEAPATSTPGGFLLQIANMTNAVIFVLENRWYGQSLPGNMTDNAFFVRTNDMELVFEDFNWFMTFIEKKFNGGKALAWSCQGGSYSGAVSSWIKGKYPDRFVYAWSSSGVVHPIFDFTGFDSHIRSVIQYSCFEAVRRAFWQFSDIWDMNKTLALQMLGGTSPIFEKADALWMLSDGSAMMVQYGGKDMLCNTMLDMQKQPGGAAANAYNNMLYRLTAAIGSFWGTTWLTSLDSGCYYSTTCMADPKYYAHWGPSGRSWVGQCCITFAWWQIGTHNSLRLKEYLTTEYYTSQCRAVFQNATMLPTLYSFNVKYGGLKPKSTRVIATHASDDPWLTAGMKYSIPAQEYWVNTAQCKECGHCSDMGTPQPNDPEPLQQQRLWIKGLVRKFMNLGAQQEQSEEHHFANLRRK